MKVYKIQHVESGLFWRGGGMLGHNRLSKNGKTWNTIGTVKQAIRLQMSLLSRWERSPITGRMEEVLMDENEFRNTLSGFVVIELSENGSTTYPLLDVYESMERN